MNKITRENYPASRLPDDLRVGVDPKARVTITITLEEERPERPPTLDEIWAMRRPPIAQRRKSTPIYAVSETNGMTDGTVTPIVYVDTNPFIYFIDGEETVANRLRPFFELLLENPGVAVTSELTLAEVLAKALPDTRRSYLNLIVWSNLIQLKPIITRDILIDTADYRRLSGRKVKLPDAIHVVTAIQSRCALFFSADARLRLPAGMAILEADESGYSALKRALA